MPSVLYDSMTPGQIREGNERAAFTKQKWFRTYKSSIWQQHMGPIQGRILHSCKDKEELLAKLMDSRDEYFKHCKGFPERKEGSELEPPNISGAEYARRKKRRSAGEGGPCYPGEEEDDLDDTLVIHLGVESCNPCIRDPTIPMKKPPLEHSSLLLEDRGTEKYLKRRYNSGLPETRFCYPPTSSSVCGWRLTENVICNAKKACAGLGRKNTIGPEFYRNRGAMENRVNYIPFYFRTLYF